MTVTNALFFCKLHVTSLRPADFVGKKSGRRVAVLLTLFFFFF